LNDLQIKPRFLDKKPAQGFPLLAFFILVPTARLELAQLSPLPPQDSVSTNFTTSAETAILTCFGHFVQRTIAQDKAGMHKKLRSYFGIWFA
jgi:hypothetical protein